MRQKQGEAAIFPITKDCLYVKPIWNTGAARRSSPLRRVIPREYGEAKADVKPGIASED